MSSTKVASNSAKYRARTAVCREVIALNVTIVTRRTRDGDVADSGLDKRISFCYGLRRHPCYRRK